MNPIKEASMIKKARPSQGGRYVGFYWTLPLPTLGFIELSDDADVASAQSKSIRYQREVIKVWIAEERGGLVGEVTFLEVQPDRATDAVGHYVKKAAELCRQKQATLVYVDFREMCGWRPHNYLTAAIEEEGVRSVPVWPSHETIMMDGQLFDPVQHFRDHRIFGEKAAAERRDTAISRLLKFAQDTPPGRRRNALIAKMLNDERVETFQGGGRPWTVDNVKKALQRLNAKQ
jgi:hypothetical protein